MKTGKGQVGAKETVHKGSTAPVQAAAAEPGQAGERLHRPSHEQRRERTSDRRLCSRCCPASGAPLVTTSPSPPLGFRPGPDRQLQGVGGERGDEGAGRERHTVAHLPDNKQLRVASEGT